MKLLFSLSWCGLIVAPPTTVFAMVATTTTKKTTKHAKKNKTSDGTSDNGTSNDGTSDRLLPNPTGTTSNRPTMRLATDFFPSLNPPSTR